MYKYKPSAEPANIAKKVIKEFYPDLKNVEIVYLFIEKTDKHGAVVMPMKGGKELWAEVKVISGLNAYLGSARIENEGEEPTPFFVVIVSAMVWNDRLNNSQREALMDSTLSRCWYDKEKDTLAVRSPDVQEFEEVVARRGAWHPKLEVFMNLPVQVALPLGEPATTKNGRARRVVNIKSATTARAGEE